MRQMSKVDTEYFKQFKERYPGWDIIRYEDNSLVFVQPIRNYPKKEKEWKRMLRSIS